MSVNPRRNEYYRKAVINLEPIVSKNMTDALQIKVHPHVDMLHMIEASPVELRKEHYGTIISNTARALHMPREKITTDTLILHEDRSDKKHHIELMLCLILRGIAKNIVSNTREFGISLVSKKIMKLPFTYLLTHNILHGKNKTNILKLVSSFMNRCDKINTIQYGVEHQNDSDVYRAMGNVLRKFEYIYLGGTLSLPMLLFLNSELLNVASKIIDITRDESFDGTPDGIDQAHDKGIIFSNITEIHTRNKYDIERSKKIKAIFPNAKITKPPYWPY